MGFFRILLLGLIAFLLGKMVYAGLKGRDAGPADRLDAQPRRRMVRCAACGTYVIEDRALAERSGSRFFCSSRCAGRDA